MTRRDWAIAVHGGAREIPPEQHDAFRAGTLRAVEAGRVILDADGSAVDAVEAAVRALEDDATFNAGEGAVTTDDGAPQFDAAIMDGATLDVGAIAAARGIRHPVSVARAALRGDRVLVTGPAIDAFARLAGDDAADAIATATATAGAEGDTVGAVALDRAGHLAAASSTGGLDGVPVGRIGDTPLPGAGLYAEDAQGAVTVSGDGESITRAALAIWTLHHGIPAALERLGRVGGEGGILLLEPDGEVVWNHSSPEFAVAWTDSEHAPHAAIRREARA